MKRFTSLLICAIMIVSMLPFCVFAAEDTSTEQDQLIALACEVFPEYSEIIRGEVTRSVGSTYSRNPNQVVFSETRSTSDGKSVSIAELSSGDCVIAVEEDSSYPITVFDDSTSDISNVGVSGTASFKVTCAHATGVFELSNVRYTIYYYASDYFTNYGSYSYSGASLVDSSTTYMEYNVAFNLDGSYSPIVTLEFYFSNNQLVVNIR